MHELRGLGRSGGLAGLGGARHSETVAAGLL